MAAMRRAGSRRNAQSSRFGRRAFEPLERRDLLAVASLPDFYSLDEDAVLDLAPTQEFVSRQAEWNYLTTSAVIPPFSLIELDADFENTWFTQGLSSSAYDGPAFAAGLAAFEYGNVDGLWETIQTEIWNAHFDGALTDTAYFWRTFDYDGDPAQVTGIVADILADDGAVLYLNGEEVGRINMGDQADTIAARASMATNESQFMEVALANRLVQGENLLAVSVHNVNLQGADMGFDMSLRITEERGSVLANDASDLEPPDDVLRVVEVNGTAVGDEAVTVVSLHGEVTMRPDGAFVYTPAANYHGVDTFSYVAADGQGVSTPTLATLEIASVNDAPVAVGDVYTLAEDTVLFAEAPPLKQVVLPSGATWDTFSDLTNGLNAPNEDYPHDAAGRSWFDPDFDIATSDPAIGVWQSGTGPFAQGDILAFAESVTALGGSGSTNTTDLFRTTFTLSEVQSRSEWVWIRSLFDDGGILNLNGREVQRWNMPSGEVDPQTFATTTPWEEYRTDAVNVAGFLKSGVNAIAFELHQGNIATSDRGFDLELSLSNPNALGVTVNDRDVENSPLVAQLVDPPLHGTVVLEPSGRFTYTPDLDYHGEDSFTYTVTDAGTPPATSLPATVLLTIAPVPDTLVAVADAYETDEDTPIVGGNVLANDFSENGPLLSTLFEQAAHGHVSLAGDGTFSYVPEANFFGVDSFRYRVSDAVEDFDVVTVEITVHAVNDPPTIAASPVYQAMEDQPLVVLVPPAAPLVVVTTGSVWSYNQSIVIGTELMPPGAYPTDPTHPEADWNDPQFSIAQSSTPWLSAASPFAAGLISGLNGTDEVTTLENRGINTILFRTSFELTVEQAAAAGVATFDALADDGGVLYVNGQEVLRINMPADGEIDPETLASTSGTEGARRHTFDIGGFVVPGTNVLAFELHQGPPARSDLSEHLRVSEIMYHPTDPTPEEEAAGFDDDGDFEFLEFVNTSERFAIDLSGTAFLSGMTFSFVSETLAAGERGVIVADLAAFRMRYGDGPRVLGQYVGGLSNGGERLRLSQVGGGTTFDFTYGDGNAEGWPVEADGDGRSLVIVDPQAATDDWNLPAQWRASTNDGGSPGASDAGEPEWRGIDDAGFDAQLRIAFADGLLSGAADVEGSGLSVVLVEPPAHGELVVGAGGAFSYSPDRNFFGDDSFRFSIVDDDPLGSASSESIVATFHVLADSHGVTCEDLDWNRSGAIDAGDVAGIARRYGATVTPLSEADFDGDGAVGLGDVVRLQTMLGTSCGSGVAAPAAMLVRAAAVDAVHARGMSGVAVVARRIARTAVAERRMFDRPMDDRAISDRAGRVATALSATASTATSSVERTSRRMAAGSVRRALGKPLGDGADELI